MRSKNEQVRLLTQKNTAEDDGLDLYVQLKDENDLKIFLTILCRQLKGWQMTDEKQTDFRDLQSCWRCLKFTLRSFLSDEEEQETEVVIPVNRFKPIRFFVKEEAAEIDNLMLTSKIGVLVLNHFVVFKQPVSTRELQTLLSEVLLREAYVHDYTVDVELPFMAMEKA